MTGSKYSEFDHLFYKDGYLMGEQAAAGEAQTEEKLFEAIEKMYRSIDQLIESLLSTGKKEGSNGRLPERMFLVLPSACICQFLRIEVSG